jgi:hypothetical protein
MAVPLALFHQSWSHREWVFMAEGLDQSAFGSFLHVFAYLIFPS